MGQSYSLRLALFFSAFLCGEFILTTEGHGEDDKMANQPTIMKFGGTSVEDAAAIGNVVAIVKLAVNSRPVIIVSAIGGFTNSLLASVEKAIAGDARAAAKALDAGFDRHLTMAKELLDKESCEAFVSTVGDARSKIRQ